MKSIVNNEFNLKVYENGEVWSLDSEWKHSSGVGVCKKIGRKLSFTPNGVGYLIANISLRREGSVKPRTLLLHRLVWCTFNGKSYDCEEKVTHIDGDCGNNCASNLRVKVNKVKAVRIREKSKAELDIDEYWECVRGGYKGKIICDANTKLPCSLSDWRLEKYGEGSPDDTFEIVGLRNGW